MHAVYERIGTSLSADAEHRMRGFETGAVDYVFKPLNPQILRNKVASLVDEMHYHFYRSGYSTIIRESRDFSCVILDRSGRATPQYRK